MMKKLWRKIRLSAKAWLDKLIDGLVEEPDGQPPATEPEADAEDGQGEQSPGPESPDGAAPPAPEPAPMNWRHGGFNGAGALEDEENKLLSVSANRDGVRFKFSGTSWWGATHENHSMRCCAFYKHNGEWVGGFWEWGSPDRTSRNFANIYDGYNGWSPEPFMSADEHAFCICSKDGRSRSNIVCTGRF